MRRRKSSSSAGRSSFCLLRRARLAGWHGCGPRAAGRRTRRVQERACAALLPEVEVIGGAGRAGR
eukprot:7380086-Lingulodinium_polyedra.AAC.1